MTGFIISVIDFVFTFLINLIPEFDFEASTYSNIEDGLLAIVTFLTDVNFIVPLSDFFLIIALKISLCCLKWGIFSANWVIRRIADIIP